MCNSPLSTPESNLNTGLSQVPLEKKNGKWNTSNFIPLLLSASVSIPDPLPYSVQKSPIFTSYICSLIPVTPTPPSSANDQDTKADRSNLPLLNLSAKIGPIMLTAIVDNDLEAKTLDNNSKNSPKYRVICLQFKKIFYTPKNSFIDVSPGCSFSYAALQRKRTLLAKVIDALNEDPSGRK